MGNQNRVPQEGHGLMGGSSSGTYTPPLSPLRRRDTGGEGDTSDLCQYVVRFDHHRDKEARKDEFHGGQERMVTPRLRMRSGKSVDTTVWDRPEYKVLMRCGCFEGETRVVAVASSRERVWIVCSDGVVYAYEGDRDGEILLEDELPKSIVGVNVDGCANLALSNSGEVYSWGSLKWLGRRGDWNVPNQLHFMRTLVDGDDDSPVRIRQTCTGEEFGLAVDTMGCLYSWGSSERGCLGRDDAMASMFPRQVETRRIIQIAAGTRHCLALSVDCTLYTWGDGSNGKLGHGNSTGSEFRPRPIEYAMLHRDENDTSHFGHALVAELAPICCINAGAEHSAFVNSSGFAFTFGLATGGRLGHGVSDHGFQSTPRLVQSLSDGGVFVIGVACGDEHTVALTKQGRVYVWGNDKQHLPELLSPLESDRVFCEMIHASAAHTIAVVRGRSEADGMRPVMVKAKPRPVPPMPSIGTTTGETCFIEGQPCRWHRKYARAAVSGVSTDAQDTANCALCLQEKIVMLSKQLREEQLSVASLKKELEKEHEDATKYRELCSRQERIDAAVQALMARVSNDAFQSALFASFSELVRETVSTLYARVIQLQGIESKLLFEKSQLEIRMEDMISRLRSQNRRDRTWNVKDLYESDTAMDDRDSPSEDENSAVGISNEKGRQENGKNSKKSGKA